MAPGWMERTLSSQSPGCILDGDAVNSAIAAGRDVYVLPMLKSWAAGGGVHCHTNDQPAQLLADPSLSSGHSEQ